MPNFHAFTNLYSNGDYVEQNCCVLVTTIYNPHSHLSAHIIEGKLKILGTNQKSEEIISFYLVATFIVMLLRGNVHVCLGCTKTWRPRISTVLHWGPPDVHMFGDDPSLVYIE